jgi:SAM-dependent methyltransferase
MDHDVFCRLCGSTHTQCLGAIPDGDYFAGRVQNHPIEGGRLWLCESCESMFRHPVLLDSEYLDLYKNGVEEKWGGSAERQDLAVIRRIIAEKSRPLGVLDVGCGAGDFLLTLPANLHRYGIEPSLAASDVAIRRGLSILAATLDELPAHRLFDVVTIIDVIEHLAYPGELLEAALPHLAPGGSLIIATGDAENAFWRRMFRSRFWYSSFPEHISFPSLKYFQAWGESNGLRTPIAESLKYRRISVWKAAFHLASQVGFLASPSLLSCIGRFIDWLRQAPEPRRRLFSPGAPGVFTDHQVITIQKPP